MTLECMQMKYAHLSETKRALSGSTGRGLSLGAELDALLEQTKYTIEEVAAAYDRAP